MADYLLRPAHAERAVGGNPLRRGKSFCHEPVRRQSPHRQSNALCLAAVKTLRCIDKLFRSSSGDKARQTDSAPSAGKNTSAKAAISKPVITAFGIYFLTLRSSIILSSLDNQDTDSQSLLRIR